MSFRVLVAAPSLHDDCRCKIKDKFDCRSAPMFACSWKVGGQSWPSLSTVFSLVVVVVVDLSLSSLVSSSSSPSS